MTSYAPISDAEFYVIGKLDGLQEKQEVSVERPTQMANFTDCTFGSDYCIYGYGCAMGSFGDTDPMFQIFLPQVYKGDCAITDAAFHSLFTKGEWQYGPDKGKVEFTYFDGKEMWSTSRGSQPETATFNIKSSYATGATQTIAGTFSCRLYNAAGLSRAFDEGSFVLNFRYE